MCGGVLCRSMVPCSILRVCKLLFRRGKSRATSATAVLRPKKELTQMSLLDSFAGRSRVLSNPIAYRPAVRRLQVREGMT
jgi:hypothetical protein